MPEQMNARARAAVLRVLDAADAAGVPVRSVQVIAHDPALVPGCSVIVGVGDLGSPEPRLRYPLPGTARAILDNVVPGGVVELDAPFAAAEGAGPIVQTLFVRPADDVVYRVGITALSPAAVDDAVVEAVLAS